MYVVELYDNLDNNIGVINIIVAFKWNYKNPIHFIYSIATIISYQDQISQLR